MATWAPVIVLALLCMIIAVINPNFLSIGNFVRMSQEAAIPLVLGLGATFIILMGSIDLSVEGVLTLGAARLGQVLEFGIRTRSLQHPDCRRIRHDAMDGDPYYVSLRVTPGRG